MIELRYVDDMQLGRDLDEVCASNASVHLERMDNNDYCLIVKDRDGEVCVHIRAPRATIRAHESWVNDSVQRTGPKP